MAKELGKLLGIHPDTVRRRAKRGEIPYTLDAIGRMLFDRPAPAPTPPVTLPRQHTNVLFVIDRSGSMHGLEGHMQDAIAGQLRGFVGAPANTTFDVQYIYFGDAVQTPTARRSAIDSLNALPNCSSDLGSTALWDAMGTALQHAETGLLMNGHQPDPWLIIVITDGQENMSRIFTRQRMVDIARRLSATDRLTLVVNCPPRAGRLFTDFLPAGNVREWEATRQGVEAYAKAASSAVMNFSSDRSRGSTRSVSYYVNPGDIAPEKMERKLVNNLTDVTGKVQVTRVTKSDPARIQHFAEKRLGGYQKGSIFYELIEKEKVQDYKHLIVQDTTTGKFFHGLSDARELLGLPKNQKGTIEIKPGTLGDFKVFVQSTSYTRKLDEGTAVVKLV